MNSLDELFKDIYSSVNHSFGIDDVETAVELEIAGRRGDVTVKAFKLAKQLDRTPSQICEVIGKRLKFDGIYNWEVVDGFLNIFLKPSFLKRAAFCDNAISTQPKLASSMSKPPENVMIEYLSPNTNKPLHLGHVRNGVLGTALANIGKANGQNIITSEMINDRGVHICKSLLAWKLWGNGKVPNDLSMKGDHFVGKWYVEFSRRASEDTSLEQQAQELLQRWEKGDEEVLAQWELMNSWFMEGFRQTCREYGFNFDTEFYESKTYKLGQEVVEDGLRKRVFRKDHLGRVVIDLPSSEFGLNEDRSARVLTLLREDGTGVYITQDLGTAKVKFESTHLDQSWHVVGSEQKYYFKSLFFVLDKLGFGFRDKMKHCSYGMVYLPEGKMKSREGTVVDADDLLRTVEMAVSEIRNLPIQDNQKDAPDYNQAAAIRAVALAAIKFYLLRVSPDSDIYFNPKESVSLEGFTGPYCQYTYARIRKMLLKAGGLSLSAEDPPFADQWLDGGFRRLSLMRLQYTDVIDSAFENVNPSAICKFIFDYCQEVNRLYECQPVVSETDIVIKRERLIMFNSAAQLIKHGLALLGIETVENM